MKSINVKYDEVLLTSVIITCHNYGRFLKESIQSVVNQTVDTKEIIVINDASDDNTESVSEEFQKQIKYYEVNFRNAQKARNFGLRKAVGRYVIFLDADDYFVDNIIEKMQKVLGKDDAICLVYSDCYNFHDTNDGNNNRTIIKKQSIDYNYSILEKYNYIALPSMIRRRKFNGFDEKVKRFQDWDAWLTLLINGNHRAERIERPLFYVRLHNSNLTTQSNLLWELIKFFAKRHAYHRIPVLLIQSKFIHEKYSK